MEKQKGSTFLLAIKGISDEKGEISYHAAEVNTGIPLEQVITITRMWLKKTENKYFDKFHDRF